MNEQPASTVDGEDYVSDVGFDDLGMSPELRRAVAERGYQRPTPVQAQVWKPAMAGRDLIVRSKTGTGKTAAFGMPLIDAIPIGTKEPSAIVLCPTRELAIQVCDELSALAMHRDIGVTAIYGGDSMQRQQDALKSGSAIIVGTPGRVQDHIRRGTLKLTNIRKAVLDEADEMLNQGFYEAVTTILTALPKGRQILLFSATVPADIERLIAQYTSDPETLLLSGDDFTVDHIKHIRYEISDAYPKPRNLLYMLEMEEPENAIIFCNTRDDTELVTAVLNRHGFDAELLNGDLPQKERERVMGRVKRGELAFMVATDIAARGIDISDLNFVVNYSLPEDPSTYLHRVGRTGRIGKSGTALNLCSGRELSTLTALEKKFEVKFEVRMMPSPEEAERMWTDRHVSQLKEAALSVVFEGYLGLASQIRARPDADELIAILLRSFFTQRRAAMVQSRDAKTNVPTPQGGGQQETGSRSRSSRGRETSPRSSRKEREPAEHRAGPRSGRASSPPTEEPRRGRRPKRSGEGGEPPAVGTTRLWLNLGASDSIEASTLSAILEGLGAPRGHIARVDVKPTFAYVDVPDADVGEFQRIAGKRHEQKVIKVEVARR